MAVQNLEKEMKEMKEQHIAGILYNSYLIEYLSFSFSGETSYMVLLHAALLTTYSPK